MKNKDFRWPFAGGYGAVIVAIFGLLGYLPGLRLLGSAGEGYIPMAPSTALCFLVLGTVLLLLNRPNRPMTAFLLPQIAVWLVAFFGLLELLGYFVGADLNLEGHIFPAMGTLNGVPIARMSPATGGLFFLSGAALSLLILRRKKAPRPWADYVLGGLNLLVLVIAALFFLAYLYGTPLLYGAGATVPMALTTALGFLFLSAALIMTAPDICPQCFFIGDTTNSLLLRLMLPLAVASAVLGGIAVLYSTHSAVINPVFLSALVTLAVSLIAAGAAAIISRRVGNTIDRAAMERVAAEARLREEQARVELYLQTAQVILMAQNLDGIITMINPKGCEVLGYPHDDLIGKNWFDCCIPQDSRDQIKKIFFLCKNPRIKPVSEHENEIRRKDGAIRLIRWHNAQLFDAAGTVIGVLSSGEDITERRIAERELEESEQRFKAIFDNADDGILLADTVTKKFTRGNLRISQMLGYTPEELTTLSITDIHPAKDLPFVLEQFEKQLQGEIELAADLPVKRKDGSLFYADINSFPLVLEGKTYLAGFFRDVTARKKAEEKLHLTLEEYRELVFIVNHSPAVAFLWKAADGWPVEYVSENVGQFGYSPEEFYSGQVSFPAVVHAGDLARVGAEVAAYSAQEECTQFTQEYRIVSPGGRVFTVDDRTWIRRNEQGEITHYQGIVLDITERKAHETLLQHFRELVNHSRDAIFVIDKEGRFIDVNEAACQSLGYTRTELLGMGILDIVRIRPDEPPFDERIDTIREKGSATFEGRHTRKDGSEFPVEVSVNVEQSEKKDTMIAIARDISERKAMESALRQKDEMMIAQSRQAAMGDMIAMIAHQWRQPITVIAMAVNNVKLDIALGEPISSKALVKMADTITDQTGHLSKTIDDFRDFFRPNKEKEKALIAEVLEGVMQIIGKSLANNNITVTVDNQSTSRLLTYPNELLQVFLNILNNAKDVLKENTVEKPRITVTITESPEAVAALFCDNGGGIPDAAISRIGEPYFTTKSVSGTGLGLYMSKTILEQHLNGALSWENRDKGACFTVTLMKE